MISTNMYLILVMVLSVFSYAAWYFHLPIESSDLVTFFFSVVATFFGVLFAESLAYKQEQKREDTYLKKLIPLLFVEFTDNFHIVNDLYKNLQKQVPPDKSDAIGYLNASFFSKITDSTYNSILASGGYRLFPTDNFMNAIQQLHSQQKTLQIKWSSAAQASASIVGKPKNPAIIRTENMMFEHLIAVTQRMHTTYTDNLKILLEEMRNHKLTYSIQYSGREFVLTNQEDYRLFLKEVLQN